MESTAYEILVLPTLVATFGAIVVGAMVLFVIHAAGALAGYARTIPQSTKEPRWAHDDVPTPRRRPVTPGVEAFRKGLNTRGTSSAVRGLLPH